MTPTCDIRVGDCLELLRAMPDNSVHCVVTSPPYYGLRDYGVAGQIGLEPTPAEFIARLVEVFEEVRRVLRPDGTLWMNMGDSYAGNPGGGQGAGGQMADRSIAKARDEASWHSRSGVRKRAREAEFGFKPKDLMGMPWRAAFALQEAGWWLRQDIVWHKPNPMPESAKDRCTKAHEYLFLLTKRARYHWNAEAIQEPVSGTANPRGSGVNAKAAGTGVGWGYVDQSKPRTKHPNGWAHGPGAHGTIHPEGRETGTPRPKQNASFSAAVKDLVEVRNKRSVWTVPTFACKDAHFATFPPDLVKPCILAGCPVGGVVLDPFGGSGTTGMVALELGRSAVLLELNPEYAEIARRRRNVTPGLPFEAKPVARDARLATAGGGEPETPEMFSE